MPLPKNLSDSLIKKLNEACEVFNKTCNYGCDDLGWCDACWIAAGSEKRKDGDTDGKA